MLLQPEQLLSHAAQIARSIQFPENKTRKILPGRLDNNFKAITEVYKEINSYAKRAGTLRPLPNGCWIIITR